MAERSRRQTQFPSVWLLLSIVVPLLAATSSGQSELTYRDRGNRHEGLLAWKPVSAEQYGLVADLLAVVVVGNGTHEGDAESSAVRPTFVRVSFFLPADVSPEEVLVEVRANPDLWGEQRSYLMDKPRPQGGWRPGEINHFAWDYDVVLGQLGLRAQDLVAVVRLDGLQAHDPRVAPAWLSDGISNCVGPSTEYRFLIRPVRTLRPMYISVREEDTDVEVHQDSATVYDRADWQWPWDGGGSRDGPYVAQFSSGDGSLAELRVHFWHGLGERRETDACAR